MSAVDLGFLEPCETWEVESRSFPSKIGGKPAWLNLKYIPEPSALECPLCQNPTIFLCQVYAPYEDQDDNFHRTIFIFICRNKTCCKRNNSSNLIAFRSNIPRKNEFYPFDPPEEGPDPSFSLSNWIQLCNVCGILGNKKCGNCKITNYCSRHHQVLDWKNEHKKICKNEEISKETINVPILFPEFLLVIEDENIKKTEVDEAEEVNKYLNLEKEGKTGTLSNIDTEELNQHAFVEKDKTFTKFKKQVEANPEQVLRYSRGGSPLWISDENLPKNIPDCEHCGSKRQFEFQIMPQLLTFLKEEDLDWGIILCYTCSQSCSGVGDYKKEFIWKQDISLDDNI